MENWGLVTYREDDLAISDDNSDPFDNQETASLICHEIAHQWFGNLVTMVLCNCIININLEYSYLLNKTAIFIRRENRS